MAANVTTVMQWAGFGPEGLVAFVQALPFWAVAAAACLLSFTSGLLVGSSVRDRGAEAEERRLKAELRAAKENARIDKLESLDAMPLPMRGVLLVALSNGHVVGREPYRDACEALRHDGYLVALGFGAGGTRYGIDERVRVPLATDPDAMARIEQARSLVRSWGYADGGAA
ncbi:hypothetical protein [uncultured Parolsenella sp.]|uniref:hypothetical protein n=1 Tax=uncultured Parolsenella sp. TaxID=2083008 RepID=UPI0027D96574|nr:hypothetical protein [uncultured Parolsenella sp.]